MHDDDHRSPRSAGALAFDSSGVLFVGDTMGGAVYALPSERRRASVAADSLQPFLFDRIDDTIAAAFDVSPRDLTFNGMAVHPTSRETYVSLGVREGDALRPAVVRVTLDGTIERVDLASPDAAAHVLRDVPDEGKTFASRAGQWPVPRAEVYDAKARTSQRTMAIVDIKVHAGELYVAGISNQEFSSTLRRIPYPFTGAESETQIEIYHLAHGDYETRAPIRTMQFADLDGEDTLVAAYACSPLVTIPVAELRDGAKVRGKTIGDMGNGQPISMVAYRDDGDAKLFITNVGRGPVIVPLTGLAGAVGYTPENRPQPGFMADTSPYMPAGPVGKEVLFVGSSLRADLFNDRFFVSLTRYADTGALTLETLPVGPLPARIDKIWVEYDFPMA